MDIIIDDKKESLKENDFKQIQKRLEKENPEIDRRIETISPTDTESIIGTVFNQPCLGVRFARYTPENYKEILRAVETRIMKQSPYFCEKMDIVDKMISQLGSNFKEQGINIFEDRYFTDFFVNSHAFVFSKTLKIGINVPEKTIDYVDKWEKLPKEIKEGRLENFSNKTDVVNFIDILAKKTHLNEYETAVYLTKVLLEQGQDGYTGLLFPMSNLNVSVDKFEDQNLKRNIEKTADFFKKGLLKDLNKLDIINTKVFDEKLNKGFEDRFKNYLKNEFALKYWEQCEQYPKFRNDMEKILTDMAVSCTEAGYWKSALTLMELITFTKMSGDEGFMAYSSMYEEYGEKREIFEKNLNEVDKKISRKTGVDMENISYQLEDRELNNMEDCDIGEFDIPDIYTQEKILNNHLKKISTDAGNIAEDIRDMGQTNEDSSWFMNADYIDSDVIDNLMKQEEWDKVGVIMAAFPALLNETFQEINKLSSEREIKNGDNVIQQIINNFMDGGGSYNYMMKSKELAENNEGSII